MISARRHWTLAFDGKTFTLDDDPNVASKGMRATEEQVETILAHWGNRILPGGPVHFIGRQSPHNKVADLIGVDSFARLHLVEIKSVSYSTAGVKALFQLLSYLINRPTSEDELKMEFARTIWYGRRSIAAYLAGLVGHCGIGNMHVEGMPARARHAEREQRKLEKATRKATERSKIKLSHETFETFARSEMLRRFGIDHDGPLENPLDLWQAFHDLKLGRTWQFGGKSVVWLLAPNVKPAMDAAQPLIDRNVDLRIGCLDVREQAPGRRWSIALEFDAEPWVSQDFLREGLRRAVEHHALRLPEFDRKRIKYWTDNSGAGIGWDYLAGPAEIRVEVADGLAKWKWYSHWWTEGEALRLQKQINDTGRRLVASGIPRSFHCDLNVEGGGNEFQNGLESLLNAAWEYLVSIGVPQMDRWATLRSSREDAISPT